MRIGFDDRILDTETRQLFVKGVEVHLQPKAFQFLELLIRNRPRVVHKDEIHRALWPGTFVSDGTLTSLLAEVRDAIGDNARRARFVRTAHRVGYAFFGSAQQIENTHSETSFRAGFSIWIVRGRLRVPLAAGESIIGRDPGAGVHLDDASVSRRHARVLITGDGATLADLGSKNGTFVGDSRIEAPVTLSDGDQVRVGSVRLLVRIFAVPASTVTSVDNNSSKSEPKT